jgi:hypothetical protein
MRVTPKMIEDLLSADPYPKVDEWEGGSIRSVSVARVSAEEDAQVGESRKSVAGSLVLQVLEFLVGAGWVVTCGHPARRYVGAHEQPEEGVPQISTDLYDRIAARWVKEAARTSGDLATLVLHDVTCGYTDARRVLHAWHESWELEFFNAIGSNRTHEVETLVELRGLIGQFAKRVRALKLPRAAQSRSWFPEIHNRERAISINTRIDRTLEDLDRLSEVVRTSFDLVQSHTAEQQLHLARHLQQKLEVITAVLLVPTLIAGIYGANTQLPGLNSWHGFEFMLALIVVAATLTWVLLRALRRRAEQRAEPT